ncbi:MAG: bifunctional precorrin-2 dehydrogenase/sirohydrochlorin ferrochelatase [Cytophagaceae bacterium]
MSESGKGNTLFPVFFRLDKLRTLVVGAGAVGLEKMTALLSNSPEAEITIVAPEIRNEIEELASKYPLVKLIKKKFEASDLEGMDLVVSATNITELNKQVWKEAKSRKILCNIADTPDLCDFYLGSIVKKGDLKIAISTNGKSPTFAKRMREMLEEVLPDNINSVLENLNKIREKLKGDFEYKVNKLNEITEVMKKKP